MKRDNLHDSTLRKLGREVVAAQSSAQAAHTRPAGQTVLRDSGDIKWTDPTGSWSVKDLPASMQTIIETKLAEGLATEGRRNTVSTSNPPTDVTGYPAGAWWSKVASADDLTVSAVWELVGGAWQSREIPEGGLVRSWADIGLLQVSVLAAKMITSGFFRTAADGQRVEIDLNGPRVIDTVGVITEMTVVRTEMGDAEFSGLRVRHPSGGVATVGMTGEFLRMARKVGQKVGYAQLADERFEVRFYTPGDGPYGGGLTVEPQRFDLSDQAGNGVGLWDGIVRLGYGGKGIYADSSGVRLTGVSTINGQPPVLASRKLTAESGLYGGGDYGADRTMGIGSGVVPLTAPVVTSGSLDNVTTLGWTSIQHTNTPSGSWGQVVNTLSGSATLIQQFRTDNADMAVWERRRINGVWNAFVKLSLDYASETTRTSNIDYYWNDGAAARINFDLGTLGPGTTWESSSRSLVVTKAGLYAVSAIVTCDAGGGNGWYMRVQQNGANLAAPSIYGGRGTATHTEHMRIKSGDRVSVEIANGSGAQIHVMKNADLTRLQVSYVGA